MSVHFEKTIIALAVFAFAVGCEKQDDKYYLKGTAPDNDRIAKAISEDPDKRAESITYYSGQWWGRSGAYLEFYATAVKRDESPIVRSAAVRALGRAGDAKYIPVMVGALRDSVPAVRWDAAVALDGVKGDAAVEPLRKSAVAETNINARVAAIRALRHYRTGPVLQTLVQCLADPIFGVNYEAHRSLVEICGQDAGYNVENWRKIVAMQR